jgi:hypothetical protein
MRKPKDSTKQDELREPADLQRYPELQLQPVSFDPPRWAERAKLQHQWREYVSIERLRTLH